MMAVVIKQSFPVGQLSNLHTAVCPAREETGVGVDMELGDPLTNVFEETAPGVLSRQRQ